MDNTRELMSWEIVSFLTPDGLELKGVLSYPKAPKGILIYIHGLTDSFTGDYPLISALEADLRKINWGILAFNNRGAGLVNRFQKQDKRKKKGYRSETIGSVYEKFEDCIYDLEGATRFISEKIMCDVILCGISTGANKVVYYCSKTKNKNIKGIVLLSPVSDIEAFQNDFGKNFQKEVKNAQNQVKNGSGDQLMPKVDKSFPFTYRRFYSLVNTEAPENTFPYIDKEPQFKALGRIKAPILIIYGQNDEYMRFDKKHAIEIFTANAKKAYSIQGKIIRGAGHSFGEYEEELADKVKLWINSLKKVPS